MNSSIDNLSKDEGLNWFKLILYTGIINIIFAILVTVYNIFAIQDYTSELINFFLLMIITLGIIVLLNLGLSVIPSVVGSARYNWPEDKQSRTFFQLFLLTSTFIVGGACIVLFFLYYPNFQIIASKDIYYATWWYSSFTFVILFIFIFYVYKVFKETKIK